MAKLLRTLNTEIEGKHLHHFPPKLENIFRSEGRSASYFSPGGQRNLEISRRLHRKHPGFRLHDTSASGCFIRYTPLSHAPIPTCHLESTFPKRLFEKFTRSKSKVLNVTFDRFLAHQMVRNPLHWQRPPSGEF
ncbi:hypothetical protein TNCV_2889801 [Trichonephila clavipes]|nr:hypothetical protein TNCV_2889801 [Trichonephila clavipes]